MNTYTFDSVKIWIYFDLEIFVCSSVASAQTCSTSQRHQPCSPNGSRCDICLQGSGASCSEPDIMICRSGYWDGPASRTVSLTIRRASHVGIPGGIQRIDDILAEASRILQRRDSSNDVRCDLTLRRSGDIEITRSGNRNVAGFIRNRNEYNRVLGAPGFVKLVATIDWCGVPGEFVGCAQQPGNSFAVRVRDLPVGVRPSGYTATTWAHEYGHTRGLGHDTSPGSVRVMRAPSNGARVVTQSECSRFLR